MVVYGSGDDGASVKPLVNAQGTTCQSGAVLGLQLIDLHYGSCMVASWGRFARWYSRRTTCQSVRIRQ